MQTPITRTRFTLPMFLAILILLCGFVAIGWTVKWATQPTSTLGLAGAVASEIPTVDARWIEPHELDRITVGIGSLVWLNSWWYCAFITDDYDYLPVGTVSAELAQGQDAIDIARWNDLTFRQQQSVKAACR